MIDAWFSSSEKTTSPWPASALTTPMFAMYPEPKSSAVSAPLNSARRCSSRWWMRIVPETRRDAPAPTPQRIAASAAASRTRGWSERPR